MKALHGTARAVIMLIVDLVEMGKVRYIGASSMFAYQFIGLQNVADKNGWTKFISMQNQYSLLYREEEREMIPACKELGVGYDSPIRQLTQGVSRGGLLRVEFSLDLRIRQRLDLPMVSSKECWHRRNSKPLERASSIVLKNWPKRKVYPWRKWQLPGFWQTMVYRSRFICWYWSNIWCNRRIEFSEANWWSGCCRWHHFDRWREEVFGGTISTSVGRGPLLDRAF